MLDGKILVHVRAPFLTLSGYGVHARQIMDYLLSDDRFLVCGESIRWGNCPYIHNDSRIDKYYESMLRFEKFRGKINFDLSLHVTVPNEFYRSAQYNIGVTAGIEVDRCTKLWLDKCNEMDLIIVPSEFSRKVLQGTSYEWENKQTGERGSTHLQKPIKVMPEWFEEVEQEPLDVDFSTTTNFLHVGQWGTKGAFGEDRKNIADMVRMFYTTFKDESNVGLVLKVNLIGNSEQDFSYTKKRLEEIRDNFKGAKCKVYLIHDTLTPGQMQSLYKHPKISAFLSLTHGEGFGLPLLEAAAAGLPVIATNWSGHLDFLREKEGFIPINYEMTEIPECQVWENVIDKGSKWAKVDEEDVRKKLKKFISKRSMYRSDAKKSMDWIKENFGKDAVAAKWKDMFDASLVVEDGTGSAQQKIQTTEKNNRQNQIKAFAESCGVTEGEREKVLYIMPRSAGDVLMNTAVADSLLAFRHTESDFYFATLPEYKELLDGLVKKYDNFKVIDYRDDMMLSDLTSEVWDYVYSPGVNVQYNFSNWLLGNGDFANTLLAEFAKQVNLHPGELTDYVVEASDIELPSGDYITFTPGGLREAKTYAWWDDVLANIKEMLPGIKIVQTGLHNERLYNGVLDYRGKSYKDTIALVRGAVFHLGVDTFTAHVAGALEVPHVVIYGSTHASTVCPTLIGPNRKRVPQLLLESSNRNGCKNPCYKDRCLNKVDGMNCVSNIPAADICNVIFNNLLPRLTEKEEVANAHSQQSLEV